MPDMSMEGPGINRLGDNMELRCANMDDAELILKWRNDADTRRNSFSEKEITLEDHLKWFSGRLSDSGCHIFILENEEKAVGNIRLDILDDEGKIGEISYMVAPECRGQGYGGILLQRIEDKAREMGISILTGLVKAENIASKKCFEKQGYAAAFAGTIISYIKLL